MPILEIKGPLDLQAPMLVLAISGWVDGGLVATKTGEHLSAQGHLVAAFRADDVFDYQTNRPTLEIADGATAEITFPALTIHAVSIDGTDLLVLSGTEPASRWQTISTELAGLAETVGVAAVVAVGAVPAMVAHTRPTPILVTSTDPELEPSGIPGGGRLVVPAALVNVLAHEVATRNGIPEVGFWAQVPHYVSGAYWPGVEAVVARASSYLGIATDLDGIRAQAGDMIARLDEAVEGRPDVEKFIREMEGNAPGFAVDDSDNLTDEIEDFLRSLGSDGDPF